MAFSIDMVLDIVLSNLEEKDLRACRNVSKFWNQEASKALRNRSSMMKEISKEDQLMELQDCMDQSWDFPFTGLQIDKPWNLSSAGAMAFFINYGARFTYLDLATKCDGSLENFCPFLHHLPRLSLLALDWCRSELPPELLDPAAGQEAGRTLKLPTLHTLRIYCFLSEDILRAVCTAAPSSLRIECLRTSYENLKGLKSAGKLQAVAVMKVDKDEDEEAEDDALRVDRLLSTQTPALTELDFEDGGCISREGLMKLLISSQKTLKTLRLDGIFPSEFSQECPVLVKLTKLILDIGPSDQHLFQEGQGHKFPALKEMYFYIKDDIVIPKVSNGTFIVPSLTKLNLWGYVNKEGIEDLARSFPNVIELILEHQPGILALSADPFDIWSVGAFKFLEKLKILDLTIQSPTKVNPIANLKNLKFMNMDTFLTGIPMTICENLRKEPRQNLKDSPFNRILRDNPNLLQLENLKELIIGLKLEDGLEELPEEPPFISMVSVWYALQMIPDLQWKFVYEDSWVNSQKVEDRFQACPAACGTGTSFLLIQPALKIRRVASSPHIQVPVLSMIKDAVHPDKSVIVAPSH